MFEPETVIGINENVESNNKCILLGYDKIPEEKGNESEFEEAEEEDLDENMVNEMRKRARINEYKKKIRSKMEKISEDSELYENSEEIIYEKDRNSNFGRILNITPCSKYTDNNLNKTGYIKTFSNEFITKNNYNLTETNKDIIRKYNQKNKIKFPSNNNNIKSNTNNFITKPNNIKYINNKFQHKNSSNNSMDMNNYANNTSFPNSNNSKTYIENKNKLTKNKANRLNKNINDNKNIPKNNPNKLNKKIRTNKSRDSSIRKKKQNIKDIIPEKNKENIIMRNKENELDLIMNDLTNEEEILEINKKPDNLELKKNIIEILFMIHLTKIICSLKKSN